MRDMALWKGSQWWCLGQVCCPSGQTSKGRSFQLASSLPPLPAQRTRLGAAHAESMPFGFNTDQGEYEAFSVGGVLLNRRTLEWKLRMKGDVSS